MTSQDQNYKVMRRRALTLAFQSRLAFATLVWLLIVTPTIVAAIPLLKWWGSKGNKQDGVISIAPVPSPPTRASKTKDVVATPPTDRFVTVAGGGPNLHRRQTATDPCLAAIPPCPAGYRCIKTRATNPAFMCAAADDTFCAGRCPAISASPALCPAMSLQFTTNNACIRGALSSCNWDRVSCPLIDCGEPGACLTSPPVPRACSDGRVPSVVRCEWDRVVNLCYWRIVDRCPTSSTTIFAVGISPPRSQTTAATQADAEYSTLYLSSQVLKSTTTVSTPPVVTGTNAATSSVAAAPTTAVSSTMTVASTTSSVTSSPATSTPVTPPSVSTKQTGLGTTATTSSSTTLASAATAPLPSTSSLVSPPASESSLSIPNIASDTSSATSLAHTDQPSAASSESATQSLSVPNTQFSTAAASPTLEVSTYIPSATLEPVTTTTGQGAGTTTSAASSTTSTTELDPLPSSTSAPGTLPSTELHSDPPAPETSAAAESITPVPTDILPAASTQTDQESIFTSSLPLSTRVTTTQEDEPPVLTDFVTLSSTSAISSTTDSASSTLIDGTLTGVFVPSTTTEVTPVSWVPGMSEDSAAASTSQKEASSFPSVSSILVPEMTATASSTSLATTVPEETAADTTSSVASTSGDSTSTAQTSGEEMSSSTIAQPTESAGSEESTTVAGLTSVEPVATSSDLELSTTVHSTATLPSAAQEPAPTGSSSTEAETISTSTSIQLETDVLTFSEPNPVSPTLSSTITDTETDILTFTPPPSSATQATSSTSGPTSTSTSQPLCVKPDCNPLACVPAGLLAEFNECRDPVTPHEECLALHGLCVPDETRAGQCGFEQPPAYWECMAAKLGPAGGSSSGLASSSSPSAVAASTMVSTDSESEAASMPSAGSETLEPTATLTMGVSAPAVTETLSATVVVPTVAVSESLGETAPATSTVTSDSEASSTADSPSITASISATMTLASTTQEPASVTVLDAATSESTSTSDSTPTTTPPSAVALPTILSSNTLVRLPVETQSFVTE